MGLEVSIKDALRILYNSLDQSGCEANVVLVTHDPLDMDIWWCAGIASSSVSKLY